MLGKQTRTQPRNLTISRKKSIKSCESINLLEMQIATINIEIEKLTTHRNQLQILMAHTVRSDVDSKNRQRLNHQ